MEKEIIESFAASIPRSELGAIQEDHEIWEETDGGAHFKVTRHLLPLPQDEREMISLSVSGEPSERHRIMQEFKEVFGVPVSGQIALRDPAHIDILAWLV